MAPTADIGPAFADPDRLRAIQRHLASFLPAPLHERFWHDGFATIRQPSFRINALRLRNGAGPGAATPACTSATGHGSDDEHIEDAVQQLLSGFGLPPDLVLEHCPYHPFARLLPAHAAAAVRVADKAHSLGPLRVGGTTSRVVFYGLGLSSALDWSSA